jgi:8-oxo-dGTP pyrophosphatase MutT (NUDIX family)
MFSHCDVLRAHASQTDAILKRFTQYKKKVPVCGAIVFNSDMSKVLMVRGWGSGASWSFPRGKINQNESLVACAIREVREETGFDMTSFVLEDEYIGMRTKDTQQEVYLFTVPRVPESTEFLPQTRQEISDIKWFFVKDLESVVQNKTSGKTKSFFLLKPFMHGIRQFSNRIRGQMGLPPLFSNVSTTSNNNQPKAAPAPAAAVAAITIAQPSPTKSSSKRAKAATSTTPQPIVSTPVTPVTPVATVATVATPAPAPVPAPTPEVPQQPPVTTVSPVKKDVPTKTTKTTTASTTATTTATVASWTDFRFDVPALLACFD